jgi:ammonium transporter Rh
MSSYFNHKFKMEDILNATLAGGVIMGCPADMIRAPAESIMIGFIAGIISTAGFNKLTTYLSEKEILHDTCGVLNLHGIPGMLGGLIGAI